MDVLRHLCQPQKNYFNWYLTCSKKQALEGFGTTCERLQEVGVKNEEMVSEDGKILISRETFQRKDCSALIYKYANKAVPGSS